MIHQCHVCKKRGEWDENWSWFGSYKDLDDGNRISKLCSERCKASFDAKMSGLKRKIAKLQAELEP